MDQYQDNQNSAREQKSYNDGSRDQTLRQMYPPQQDRPPAPKDLLTCACELRNCLFALGGLHQALWRSAFLPTPTEEPPVAPESDRLEGVLRDSCRMAQALVREAQTINAKLIGPSK